jgi:GntR family transcriptional regulator
MVTSKIVRVPIYEQLNKILSELVRSDEFTTGDKFLTERQICERFDVSRATANKAMTRMVADGILKIKKGIGTFVKDPDYNPEASSFYVSFTNKTLAAGKKPTTKVIDLFESKASKVDPMICKKLSIKKTEGLIICRRIRLADKKPLILETHYFRKKFYKSMTEKDVNVSIFDMHKKKYGITLHRMDETIRTILLSGNTAKHLKAPNGTPAFLMHFIPCNEKKELLYFAEVIYRGDLFEFHNRIGPIHTSRAGLSRVISEDLD